MNQEQAKLSLRVFKRSNKHLALLWRRIDGADPLATEITFKNLNPKMRDSRAIKLDSKSFYIDEPAKLKNEEPDETGEGLTEQLNISADTVVCIVKEKEVGLDPSTTYYVKVKYGGEEEGIRLTPAGVFPSHERENRQKNMHLYIWDEDSQTWRKAAGVRGPDGRFYLGTIIVNLKDGKEADEAD